MSRRQQVVQARKALERAQGPLQQPQQQQVGLEGLVPLLVQSGAKIGVGLKLDDDHKAVIVHANCRAITIPAAITDMAFVRKMALAMLDAAEKYDPQPEEDTAAEPGPYDDLLAESIAKTSGGVIPLPAEAATDVQAEVDEIFTGPSLPQLPAPEPSRFALPSW